MLYTLGYNILLYIASLCYKFASKYPLALDTLRKYIPNQNLKALSLSYKLYLS